MAHHPSRRRHRAWPLIVLGAMLCLASAASRAAAPALTGRPASEQGPGLKLDLGLAMSDDDCEEDYADLLHVAATGAAPAPAKKIVPAAAVAPASKAAVALAAAPAPAPAAPAVPAPVAVAVPSWEVLPADKTLNAAIARWAAAAGWQLVWELPVDYAVTVRTEIHGSFTDAVAMVAKSMESAEIPMKAIFYDGNHVLRIVAKGSQ